MADFEQKILSAVLDAVRAVYDIVPEEGSVIVETPKDTRLGDYATNAAMKLSRALRKNPMEIAEPLVAKLY